MPIIGSGTGGLSRDVAQQAMATGLAEYPHASREDAALKVSVVTRPQSRH